jgi:hypothetical protein
MPYNHPGEVELHTWFSQHVGPRFQIAGLRVQFHYNQAPGVHFQVAPPQEYEAAIIQGIEDGLTECFPNFPLTGSVWINEVIVDEVNSSQAGFYRAGLLAIHQAKKLVEISSRVYGSPSAM